MHDNLAYWWYKNYASESMHKISVYILKWDEFQVKLSMREKKKKHLEQAGTLQHWESLRIHESRSLAILEESCNSRQWSQVDVGRAPSLGIWKDATYCESQESGSWS